MADGLISNISTVWTAATVILSLAVGLQIGSVFVFMKEAPKYNIQTNSFTDLYVMGVALCFISLYRHITTTIAKPRIEARLRAIEPGCPDSKIDKNTRALVGTIWYTFTTVGYFQSALGFVSFLRPSLCPQDFSRWLQLRRSYLKVANVPGYSGH